MGVRRSCAIAIGSYQRIFFSNLIYDNFKYFLFEFIDFFYILDI